ncbi:bifunctional folylpolyglutamate synthase/dihydrofolate synthase [Rhodoplanes roseus]|uniref:Dihydrofolate synthase/folylpolyglutamate synthase n=1 Tax=Rhodoplanes roseus TaxID=29409 RepID=A0A327L020_9BRAD|nr:folylpolyglutamate synthase/dihydrofolate synthase family protein [Rhodoplanes roseus]RAI43255.1 bifunctional folylpolyglutamate synthase/dihydrofolate synthase [Rhodoplanes roseus]
MTPPAPVDAILARLLALHPRRIDLTLGRMTRLLAALDHPERRLPPAIHVAGTNGKGSTLAFMRAMLEAAGKRVHVYTSPHLVRINERFRLARAGGGELVSDQELSDVLAHCERRNGGEPITVFEIETAAAFMLFARHPADVLLLEVGLGGRLDATNVVERPLASVVTPVSMDHVEFLGDTLAKIAVEKAGILKRGVPAVIARQIDVARDVLVERGEAVGAVMHVAGQDWMSAEERGRLVFQDGDGLLDLPAPRLFGRHQFDNAGTAIAALRAAGLGLPVSAYEQGLVKAEWPARMQRLTAGALVAAAPAGSELWLDGGHNADGGRAVAAALGDLEERVSRPLVLIVGMLSTKDVVAFLQNFVGLALRLVAVTIHQEKGLPAEDIAVYARDIGLPTDVCDTLDQALARVAALDLDPPPRILITGSLYLAGEVLAANGTPPR